MKSNIHPIFYHDAIVTCACGNTFTTGSTKKTIQVDICNACHPFFTGEMKFVDTQGRVDKFQQKMNNAQTNYVSKKQRKAAKDKIEENNQPKSLKEMIQAQQKEVKAETSKKPVLTKDESKSSK